MNDGNTGDGLFFKNGFTVPSRNSEANGSGAGAPIVVLLDDAGDNTRREEP